WGAYAYALAWCACLHGLPFPGDHKTLSLGFDTHLLAARYGFRTAQRPELDGHTLGNALDGNMPNDAARIDSHTATKRKNIAFASDQVIQRQHVACFDRSVGHVVVTMDGHFSLYSCVPRLGCLAAFLYRHA